MTPPLPAELIAYLRASGWTGAGTTDRWALFSLELDGEPVRLEVPLLGGAADYDRRVAELLSNLEIVEHRPVEAIAKDIRASLRDVVRLSLQGPALPDPRLPVEVTGAVYARARDLLLAAACAAVAPRPVYATRKPEAAMEYIRRARFGMPEQGSCVLTVEVDVPPSLQLPLDAEDDPDPPFGRRVHVTLAGALQAAHQAATQAQAASTLAPFLERTDQGVSANLCESIAGLLGASGAERLGVSLHFASARPVSRSVPRNVEFGAGMEALLREVGSAWRRKAAIPDAEVVGFVHKLESSDPSAQGQVWIAAEVEGQVRMVVVVLEGDDYQRAVSAHAQQLPVRLVGELRREGRTLKLTNPREFAALALPD